METRFLLRLARMIDARPGKIGIDHALAGDGVVDLSGLARSGDPRVGYFFNGSRAG
jgi:hypothetical protein